ncbi:hypothetical protein D910_09451, partial [Dendroctonus ponderosae]
LNEQSQSESEVKEDDNETETAKSCDGQNVQECPKKKRKKKKKKNSGKHAANQHRSSEDNADLNEQSQSESEVKEDDNETETAKSCDGQNVQECPKKKRKKKKKKNSGKHAANQHRSSEDNADVDEVERSLREVNSLLGETPQIVTESRKAQHHQKSILNIQHKHLNPNNELKRIFGSKVIQAEHKRKSRSGSRTHLKTTWMVAYKEHWQQANKSGLSMALLETKDGINYFVYEHNQNYRQVENRFLR